MKASVFCPTFFSAEKQVAAMEFGHLQPAAELLSATVCIEMTAER